MRDYRVLQRASDRSIPRDGRAASAVFAVAFIPLLSIEDALFPDFSSCQVPLIFFPLSLRRNVDGDSLRRIFHGAALYAVHPRTFGTCLHLLAPPWNALRGVCAGIHCRPSRWISVYANRRARKVLERKYSAPGTRLYGAKPRDNTWPKTTFIPLPPPLGILINW